MVFTSASRNQVGGLLRRRGLLGGGAGGAVLLAGWPAAGAVAAGMAGTPGDTVAVSGAGTASKATTISNW